MAIENHELIDIIKAKQGDSSLRTFATSLGYSAAYLSDVFRGRRAVGPGLADAFGYVPIVTRHVQFKKKGRSK
jgi:hypothetical protein